MMNKNIQILFSSVLDYCDIIYMEAPDIVDRQCLFCLWSIKVYY